MLIRKISLLDDLLNRIAEKLQLNQTRIEKAEQSYKSVIKWLEEDEQFFGKHSLNIYPQGSYKLGTTVKPKGKDEYDLDFVLEVDYDSNNINPVDMLKHLERRLKANGIYEDKVEAKKRCVAINYDGDFHMDIIPAVPKYIFEGEDIKISDRKLEEWIDSCPKGYINWFESKFVQNKILLEKAAAVEELPSKVPYTFIQPLQRVVQLMKRHRDIYFKDENEDYAPRSIVLTTLAGTYYNSWESENESLMNILVNISKEIKRNPYSKIVVKNPALESEKFSDLWESKPHLYKHFVDFINSFLSDWQKLNQLSGIDKISTHLQLIFGEEVSKQVIAEQADYVEELRKANRLGITTLGTLTPMTTEFTSKVARNNFFGDE